MFDWLATLSWANGVSASDYQDIWLIVSFASVTRE
jgi:hypothetical protein